MYAGKNSDTIFKAEAPGYLLCGSLVSPALEAAVMNAKYVNAAPLYRQEKEFERYGLAISSQDMAYWTIQCAERYLAILYDYLHDRLYDHHVLQADETPVLLNKDGARSVQKAIWWRFISHGFGRVFPRFHQKARHGKASSIALIRKNT